MFFLFCFYSYYPEGGMSDYQGAFPTLEAAIARDAELKRDYAQVAQVNAQGKLVLVWQRDRDD